MSALSEIKDLIQQIAANNGRADNMVFEAEVIEVEDETITIWAEDMELTRVRTCASSDGDTQNLRIYPVVGSTVVCLDIAGDRRDIVVLQYSAIDHVTIHGGKHTTINGDLLVDQLQNLTDRVDALYEAFKNWSPVSQDGGSALKGLLTTALSKNKTEDYSKVEDKTIKH